MDAVKPPGPLKVGNVDASWKIFKQQFQLHIVAVGADRWADERKIAMLLTDASTEVREVFNTLVFTQPDDKDKLDEVTAFQRKTTYERYIFCSPVQQLGESFDNFLTNLKTKAQSCNFDNLKDTMIRDLIVFGTNEKKLREKLLRET